MRNSVAVTSTDTGADHNINSAFKESVSSDNEESKRSPSPEVHIDEEFISTYQEVADSMSLEIKDATIGTHISEIPNGRMMRNCFPWKRIQTALGFFNFTAERGKIFATNETYDEYIALTVSFSPQRTTIHPRRFSFLHIILLSVYMVTT